MIVRHVLFVAALAAVVPHDADARRKGSGRGASAVAVTAASGGARAARTRARASSAGGGAALIDDSAVSYRNCTAARAAGAAPVRRGEPGYARHLDRDNDGVGCE